MLTARAPLGRAAFTVSALLLISGAVAGFTLMETIQVDPASGTPPATLEHGTDGSTTFGSSETSASTTLASTPIIGTFNAEVLEIAPGPHDVAVRVELLAETAGTAESLSLELDDGVSPVLQVDVVSGVVSQSIGSAVTLDSAGSPLVVTATGTESLLTADTVYTMQVLITPVSGDGSEARYDYTLTVT